MPRSVLVIEDDDLAAFVLLHMLSHWSADTITHRFAAAEEAMEYLDHLPRLKAKGEAVYPPDIILLDIHLPGMDAFQFLDAYRTQLRTNYAHTQIWIMTNGIQYTWNQKVESEPLATGLMLKPVERKQLTEILEAIPARDQSSSPI